MANFANTPVGFRAAEVWARAKMVDGTWVAAHAGHDKNGNTICRFQRFMSATNPGYGAWVESRADDAT